MPAFRSRLARFAAAALLLSTGAASAAGTLAAAFPPGKLSCFYRNYDSSHMARHPAQEIEAIWLGRTTASAADPADSSGRLALDFGFRLADATFEGRAYCRGARCDLEGDAGSFTLSRKGEALRIAVGSHLVLEGDTGASPDLAKSRDDQVFLLPLERASACGG